MTEINRRILKCTLLVFATCDGDTALTPLILDAVHRLSRGSQDIGRAESAFDSTDPSAIAVVTILSFEQEGP